MDGRDARRERLGVGRVCARGEASDADECGEEEHVVDDATKAGRRKQIIGILVRVCFLFTASETTWGADLCVRANDDRYCKWAS